MAITTCLCIIFSLILKNHKGVLNLEKMQLVSLNLDNSCMARKASMIVISA